LITNKSLIVASSWSHLYLLFKDARSFEYKVRIYFNSVLEAKIEHLSGKMILVIKSSLEFLLPTKFKLTY